MFSVCMQAAEQDFNDDGKPDVITLKVQAAPSHAVHGVQVLLQFQYKLAVSRQALCAAAPRVLS